MTGFEFGEGGRKLALALSLLLASCGRTVYVNGPAPDCQPKPHADPGPDKTVVLGLGTATWVKIGGKSVGNCHWSPIDGLDDGTKCNPIAAPQRTTEYQLVVTTPCGQAAGKMTVNVYAED